MGAEDLKSVVLVEDIEEIRFCISEELCRTGYQVYEAEDGQKALGLIMKNRGPHLALITDLDMPNMRGDRLIREVDEKDFSFSAYILISAYQHTHPDIRALQNIKTKVPIYLIQKPFLSEELNALLGKIRVSSEAIATEWHSQRL